VGLAPSKDLVALAVKNSLRGATGCAGGPTLAANWGSSPGLLELLLELLLGLLLVLLLLCELLCGLCCCIG